LSFYSAIPFGPREVLPDGNDAQEIHTTAFLEEKMNYIHNIPVKAEVVGRPEDYLYSPARDYAGEKGLVEIVFGIKRIANQHHPL
jgi:putative transposase